MRSLLVSLFLLQLVFVSCGKIKVSNKSDDELPEIKSVEETTSSKDNECSYDVQVGLKNPDGHYCKASALQGFQASLEKGMQCLDALDQVAEEENLDCSIYEDDRKIQTGEELYLDIRNEMISKLHYKDGECGKTLIDEFTRIQRDCGIFSTQEKCIESLEAASSFYAKMQVNCTLLNEDDTVIQISSNYYQRWFKEEI